MDEIRDLQRQLQLLKNDVNGSTMSFHNELSGIKTTVNSVLRKETLTLRNRSLSLGVQETWTSSTTTTSAQNAPRSPLVNEVRPPSDTDKGPSSPIDQKNSADLLSPGPRPSCNILSRGPPSPGLPSPGMPSPTFSVYSENNMVMIPPAPPKAASLLKFTGMMVTGHLIGVFIPNTLLRIFVLGCITDVCMLAFASPHLPSSAEYLFSLWRSSR